MTVDVRVGDLAVRDTDLLHPDDPVLVARRRMEAEARRSLLVVDGERPVGLIQWRDLVNAEDDEQPVRVWMTVDIPILPSDLTVDEARGRLGEVDFDRLPVVDDMGRLIGEVARQALTHFEVVVQDVPGVDPSAGAGTDSRSQLEGRSPVGSGVVVGMNVLAADGKKLGSVGQPIVEPSTDQLAAFTVQHGALGRKRKRLPADAIDRIEGDAVVLAIGKAEFDLLPDAES